MWKFQSILSNCPIDLQNKEKLGYLSEWNYFQNSDKDQRVPQMKTTPKVIKTRGPLEFNTLRPRQNGRHFPDDILKWIFFNENVWIPTEISLKFVPKGSINNNPALFQIMAWRRPGDKPLSEPMMVRLPAHICVTRPQWVKDILVIHCWYIMVFDPTIWFQPSWWPSLLNTIHTCRKPHPR